MCSAVLVRLGVSRPPGGIDYNVMAVRWSRRQGCIRIRASGNTTGCRVCCRAFSCHRHNLHAAATCKFHDPHRSQQDGAEGSRPEHHVHSHSTSQLVQAWVSQCFLVAEYVFNVFILIFYVFMGFFEYVFHVFYVFMFFWFCTGAGGWLLDEQD